MASEQKITKPAAARGNANPQDKRKNRAPLAHQLRKSEQDQSPSFVFTDWASI
ncbi:MAG: hypothetical protein ACWA47_04835 [Brevirhabdus sp.]